MVAAIKDGDSSILIQQIKDKNSELNSIREKLETHAKDSQWLIKHYKDQIEALQLELKAKENDFIQEPILSSVSASSTLALSDDVERLKGPKISKLTSSHTSVILHLSALISNYDFFPP